MALSRNFRTTYYKTLGVPVVQHIVDVEASYHALFAEPLINLGQLRKLALEVGVSPTYRATAWKVLCGVLPTYKCLWEMAEIERQQMYEDFVSAARVLQLPHREERRPRVADSTVTNSSLETLPESETARSLIRLYHTYRNDILCSKPLQFTDVETTTGSGDAILERKTLERIAMLLQTVLAESVADQFWCFVRIIDILDEAQEMVEPIETCGDAAIADFEMLFIRALECIKSTGRP